MLVLTRKLDQAIAIGPDVIVTVVAIQGDQVRLGVTAPADVRIDRAEIRDRPDYRGDYREGGGR